MDSWKLTQGHLEAAPGSQFSTALSEGYSPSAAGAQDLLRLQIIWFLFLKKKKRVKKTHPPNTKMLLLRAFSACAYINKITWIIESVNLKRICCATFVTHPHSVWALRSKVMFFEFSFTGDLAFFSQYGWGWQWALEVLTSNPAAPRGPPQAQGCVQLAFECL